ncbi:hypothetical protein MSG28_010505 [Choristoneura fumiferana]|uniref:Uncharacterized protein n=1 Tax=Choristoneura fumiferana TaxID=7141 RepID=A0ACC0KL13_CHOFU|nr:hypothetical protein MSG28_010505 [Choristoneura fumiferana]
MDGVAPGYQLVLWEDTGIREPTVVGVPNFNAAEDAATLRAAMKGFGTDEQAIIDILTSRSNIQRQAIAQAFTHEYGRDIIEDLKSELGGHFEDVIVALMRPPAEYLCKELHNCMEGMGTDENTLVEILCTRTKKEIAEIVDAYERLYNRPLAEHMCSETSGDFRRLLTLIVTSPAAWFATRLRAAMQGLGTDDRTLVRIVVSRSELDLAAIAREYERLYDKTLESEIRVFECVENAPAWFAQRLRAAVEGAGTDDAALIRIIASRAEIDLGSIKREYELGFELGFILLKHQGIRSRKVPLAKHPNYSYAPPLHLTNESAFLPPHAHAPPPPPLTLRARQQGETSGDYKRALVALLGPA